METKSRTFICLARSNRKIVELSSRLNVRPLYTLSIFTRSRKRMFEMPIDNVFRQWQPYGIKPEFLFVLSSTLSGSWRSCSLSGRLCRNTKPDRLQVKKVKEGTHIDCFPFLITSVGLDQL